MNWELLMQVVEVVSVVGTSVIALLTVGSWRAEHRYTRRAELAGEGLTLAYEAADVIQAVRSNFGYESDGSTRKRMPNETPQLTERLDDAFTPVERLCQHDELFGKLRAMRYRMMVEFGRAWEKRFDELFEVRHKLIVRCRRAMRLIRDQHESPDGEVTVKQEQFWEEFEQLRWQQDDPDPVDVQVQGVVQRLEALNESIRKERCLTRLKGMLTKARAMCRG